MKEGMKVKCPECGNQIPLEESEYNYIVDQVCREEVSRRVAEISERLNESAESRITSATERLTHDYEIKLETARTEFVKLKDKFNQERAGYMSRLTIIILWLDFESCFLNADLVFATIKALPPHSGERTLSTV